MPLLLKDFIHSPDLYGSTLVLVDIDEAALTEIHGFAQKLFTGTARTTYRLLAYVTCTMTFNWRRYTLSTPKHFYSLKAA